MLSDLVVAIDLSEDGSGIIALVGAREHVLKSHEFSTIAATLKHYRTVQSKRKHSYIKAFPRRYLKLYKYIEIARVYIYTPNTLREVNRLLQKLEPALVIVDDKLHDQVDYPEKQKRGEGKPREDMRNT